MIVTYGGHDVDLGDTVYLIGWGWRWNDPIFHRVNVDDHGVARTRCGHQLWNRDGDNTMTHTWLAPRYAVKFARPCATCWPELRNQPALFKRRRAQSRVEQEQFA